eukprot:m.442830 g.442830  ORF g.442830 m.442830 type:complete len:92 (-) comp56817_c0_seq47:1054-1329(-)
MSSAWNELPQKPGLCFVLCISDRPSDAVAEFEQQLDDVTANKSRCTRHNNNGLISQMQPHTTRRMLDVMNPAYALVRIASTADSLKSLAIT